MKKSKYFLTFVSQRAAGGGIAADQTGGEWASEGERKSKYVSRREDSVIKDAYVSMHEWMYMLHQAGWHRRSLLFIMKQTTSSCPCVLSARGRGFSFGSPRAERFLIYFLTKKSANKKSSRN